MRLMTARASDGTRRLGAVLGQTFVDLERFGRAVGAPIPGTMLELIDLGLPNAGTVSDLLNDSKGRFPLGTALPLQNVVPLAPIPRPRKNIFAIGLNYAEHVDESARALQTQAERPDKPVVFTKPPTAVIGPGEPIQHNLALTQQLDWEVELAVVIGTTARRVSAADAMAHVYGYTVLIDVSARDCRRGGQWLMSKGQDTFAPMGPVLVTADEIKDPHALDLSLSKNGVVKQSSNTRHMMFKVPDLISDLSQSLTLEPGDILATGTPAGVGAGRDPQEWLWPGDVVEATVQAIGTIRHPVVAV